jgi:hypothetical protein
MDFNSNEIYLKSKLSHEFLVLSISSTVSMKKSPFF